MKRMSFVTNWRKVAARVTLLLLVAVAMSATLQASVTLTSLTGSPNVPGTATFAVNAASSARELWCA